MNLLSPLNFGGIAKKRLSTEESDGKIFSLNWGWERECYSHLTAVNYFRKKLHLRYLNAPLISVTGSLFSQRLGAKTFRSKIRGQNIPFKD